MENIMIEDIGKKKGVAITFDDGKIDNYEIAFPIMKRYGIKASFFVPTKKIGTRGYCSWKQLKEMARFGNTIESHTHSHTPLDELSEKDIIYELKTSADLIEKKIGRRPKYLSLPGGRRFDTEIAKKLGYEGCRTSQRGFSEDPWDLEVVMMLNNSILNVV